MNDPMAKTSVMMSDIACHGVGYRRGGSISPGRLNIAGAVVLTIPDFTVMMVPWKRDGKQYQFRKMEYQCNVLYFHIGVMYFMLVVW